MRRRPRSLRGAAALIGLILILLVAAISPTEAHADEVSDKRAEAEAIAAKIKQLDHEIEKAAESANGAQVELDEISRQIADSQAQVASAQAQQASRAGELKSFAINAYDRGTPSDASAPTEASDLASLGQRQGYLSAAAGNRLQLIDQLRASEHDLQVKVAVLDDARGAAEAKTQLLRDKQAQAQSAVEEQGALYAKAEGELSQLVAEAQQREAAKQEAAARARQEAAARARPPRAPSPGTRSSPPASTGPGSGSGTSTGPAARGGVDEVIAEAKRQLGKPYVWGADGPDSFDCSGFTQWAWKAGGVSLPHYSGAQYSSTTHVSMSAIQPGDLIFYEDPGSHVALYIGNGTIIHAPNSRSVVRYDSLYYWDTAMMASRP
jgi:cell wall-associated NlpC family hydrolase